MNWRLGQVGLGGPISFELSHVDSVIGDFIAISSKFYLCVKYQHYFLSTNSNLFVISLIVC